MILGHSDPAPLPLVSEGAHVSGEYVTADVLRLWIGCKLPYMDDSIKRALAERGDKLRRWEALVVAVERVRMDCVEYDDGD